MTCSREWKRFAGAKKYFNNIEDIAASNADTLDEWLADPVVSTHLDPIAYWTGMQAAGHPLSRMALDFLSIPGTSA